MALGNGIKRAFDRFNALSNTRKWKSFVLGTVGLMGLATAGGYGYLATSDASWRSWKDRSAAEQSLIEKERMLCGAGILTVAFSALALSHNIKKHLDEEKESLRKQLLKNLKGGPK